MAKHCVIGAGPAGCISAKTLSKQHDVVLFEEHKKQPIQCAGLLSVSGLKLLGLEKGEYVKNTVYGAKLISPCDRVFEIRTQKPKAHVVDRCEFDEFLLSQAKDSGVDYVNEKVIDVVRGRVKTKSGELNADKTVLATGGDYTLQNRLGLPKPKNFLVGVQYDMKVECDPDIVELHFNVPGFFSWIIPVEDVVRVGLCYAGNPTPYLESFIKKLAGDGRLVSDRVFNKVYGVIPVYDPSLKTVHGNIKLVGDSAGQVKATTGGGVILGGLSATCIIEDDYEGAWKKKVGRELWLHLMIRKFLDRLSPKRVDGLFSLLDDSRNSLERGGDMDLASQTLKTLFKNPTFAARFLTHLPEFLFDVIA